VNPPSSCLQNDILQRRDAELDVGHGPAPALKDGLKRRHDGSGRRETSPRGTTAKRELNATD
jgi:hypothetical protein